MRPTGRCYPVYAPEPDVMKATNNSITSLPPSPSDDRHSRMIKYAVAMGIRMVCLILCFVVPLGWWTIVPVIGAVVLPYIAVVLANVGHEAGDAVASPGAVQVYRTPDATPWSTSPTPGPAVPPESGPTGGRAGDRGDAS